MHYNAAGKSPREACALVIVNARAEYGQGAPTFDFRVCSEIREDARRVLDLMIFYVANNGRHCDDPVETQKERYREFRAYIQDELNAYLTKCRTRKYTGWSALSRGPIRYAD